MTHALLFDLDGTLLHSDPLHELTFKDLLLDFGVDLAPGQYIREFHGRQNEAIFADILPNEDAHALSIRKETMFRERLGGSATPMAGLLTLLDRAKAEHWATAVVTNAPRINAEAMLAALNLSDHFDTIVIGEECSAGKPDPAPYLTAMAHLNAAPATSLAFEDSPSGICAARAAQIYTYGVRSSLTHQDLTQIGASATIADFTDPALLDHLTRLQGETI